MTLEHSRSMYRYFVKHRSPGARAVLRPPAWLALRARAEIVSRDAESTSPVKAVVLVGGEGTRLRPLTETLPKPLLPMVDRPFLDHVLDHLAAHGVDSVVLSSPYLEEMFHPFIETRAGEAAVGPVDHRGAATRHRRRHRQRARPPRRRRSSC